MTTQQLTADELQELRDLAHAWGKIVARRASRDGSRLDFDFNDLEHIAQVAADALTEGTLDALLERQAQTLGATQPCPDCGRPCDVRREPRPLDVAGGITLTLDEPICHCPACRRDFCPLRTALRLDSRRYSPALSAKIVTAGGYFPSFANAAFSLGQGRLDISAHTVQVLTEDIGTEMAQHRDDQAVARRQRRLKPRVASTPDVVAVEVDGGRLRTRAAASGRGVHQAQNNEDKIALLTSLDSSVSAVDPCPEPPPSFVQPRRIVRLVRQMAGQASDATHPMDTPEDASPAAAGDVAVGRPEQEPWSPRRRVRTCVASMTESTSFGPLVAAEAQARDFFAAPRRAFVGDGAAYNWSIWQGYFAAFEPIVDLLHVVCYLFGAAQAVGSVVGTGAAAPAEPVGWSLYVAWLRSCWQGRVGEVVAELRVHQESVGRPPPGEELPERDPRRALAEALSYLGNNAARMDYPRYRCLGLPTTSSLVESLVGEFNARVKSKQKYWSRDGGAEAILQVRAGLLSEDGRLERFFAERPGCPYQRRSTERRRRTPLPG